MKDSKIRKLVMAAPPHHGPRSQPLSSTMPSPGWT